MKLSRKNRIKLKASWGVLSSEVLLTLPWFRLRTDRCELPDGRIMPKYYVLEFQNWVNVVALTKDGSVVFVRQFRQARECYTLEIPGGGTNKDEAPLEAAKRELLEETGYSSNDWQLLGEQAPNPALQNNLMYTYLAKDCEKISEPTPDAFEDLETVLVEEKQVDQLVKSGEINHSIVLGSLLLYRLAK